MIVSFHLISFITFAEPLYHFLSTTDEEFRPSDRFMFISSTSVVRYAHVPTPYKHHSHKYSIAANDNLEIALFGRNHSAREYQSFISSIIHLSPQYSL